MKFKIKKIYFIFIIQFALGNFATGEVFDQSFDRIPYYGKEFYNIINDSSVSNLSFDFSDILFNSYKKNYIDPVETNPSKLRNQLYLILSGFHIKKNNDYDSILESCPDDMTCSSHHTNSYKQARRYLFGRIHLESLGNDGYQITSLYCSHTLTQSDFPKGQGLGPDKIPASEVLNTEHIWPQSRFNRKMPIETQKTDLHILYPVISSVNSSRGNIPFGMVDRSPKEPCPNNIRGYSNSAKQDVFQAGENSRGNIARAIFYFSVRYKIAISDYEESVLRNWHIQDPVDEQEIIRNQMVEDLQGVRNPFVDFPDLIDYFKDL